MMQQARRTVHTCGLCQAVFEGPRPPVKCPQCQAVGQWGTADVVRRDGVVGGQVVLSGTSTPQTRVFYCSGCTKMTVTRDGSDPAACDHCGGEAWVEASPQKKIQIDQTPVASKPKPSPVQAPPAPASDKLDADTYRSEWIAERVVAVWDAGHVSFDLENSTVLTRRDHVSMLWTYAEQIYDEGRQRGHLP
jgi:hypothetical protein